MVTGRHRKCAAYFDKEHPLFEDFSKLDKKYFITEVDKYFLKPDSEKYLQYDYHAFEFAAYLDVLIAPRYVFQKEKNVEFDYPHTLVWLFKKLFPTDEDYSKALQSHFNDLYDFMQDLMSSHQKKAQTVKSYERILT